VTVDENVWLATTTIAPARPRAMLLMKRGLMLVSSF